MSEDHRKLLDVFEIKLNDLLALCEKQQKEIKDLTQQLKMEKESIQQTEQKIQALNAKYSNLLTAHVASLEDGDVKSARTRLLKLVREVEKCIALLNG
jgi:DNA repair ATPase RecN